MGDQLTDVDDLPATPKGLAEEHPEVWDAYSALGKAGSEAGPITDDTKRLVKLALAIGIQSEGAVHSHVRRGLDEGISPEAMKHVALLSIPTVGFPRAVAALSWIEDLTDN